jgi:murein DD-endopeptidase MepM/ murein hydrolase activator NlpD
MPSRRTANEGPDRTLTPSTGGKRRAVRTDSLHTGGRKKLLPGLPSVPSLVGVAALALAVAGATISQQPTVQPTVPPVATASDVQKFTNQASVLNAGSSTWSGSALNDRARAVSRDSQREALQDAAVAELQAAAESQAKERNAALDALAASAAQYADQVAARAAERAAERAAARAAERAARLWQLPLPAGSYRLSSRFGECSYLWANCHTGLDFAASFGTQIYNVAAGVVSEVGYEGSYGNRTIVTLPDGTEMWYCHQNSFAVSVGDQVAAGELIGYVGSTGNSTGPHLHLEVHPGAGDAVDPMGAALVRGLQF